MCMTTFFYLLLRPKTNFNEKQKNCNRLTNNSNVAHDITIENSTYNIGAYHYKSVVLAVSGTNTIKCDTRGDTANINVSQ